MKLTLTNIQNFTRHIFMTSLDFADCIVFGLLKEDIFLREHEKTFNIELVNTMLLKQFISFLLTYLTQNPCSRQRKMSIQILSEILLLQLFLE